MYTFGFGSDHDADMLEAISTQGGGVYYYIDTNEKVRQSAYCMCSKYLNVCILLLLLLLLLVFVWSNPWP